MPDVNSLGYILKRIGNYDKMSTFNGRLRLQKTVYIMQMFDLYIGYNFSWYVRGPYCSDLATDGYRLRGIYDELPQGKFTEPDAERRFEHFLEFMGDKKHDADWLEIIASIHFLKIRNPAMPQENIIKTVKNKQWYFTEEQCKEAWDYLKGWSKIS